MTTSKVISEDASRISKIRPFLYLSGLAPLTPASLKPFTCLINCVAGLRQVAPPHLTVLHIPIEDDEETDLTPYWHIVFRKIDDQKRIGGKVLIFCGMGISRLEFFVNYIITTLQPNYGEDYHSNQWCRSTRRCVEGTIRRDDG
uniref:Tyrosine-protein phosphatase domain-containing protein n=1 Tax=Setaria digitata TaxID=48799 RepID=A0A915Q058_9BILA